MSLLGLDEQDVELFSIRAKSVDEAKTRPDLLPLITEKHKSQDGQIQKIERALDDIYPPVGGTKYDDGKPMMSLVDPYVLTEMARVLTYGARKYSPDNWRKGFNLRRILDACLRHISAWSSGQDVDEETGLSHLAHAMCCLMFLMWLYKFRPELDDRYKEPAV